MIYFADFCYITGSESLGVRNYNAAGFVGWNYTSTAGTSSGRLVNNGSAGTTKSVTATIKENIGSTSFSTATWNSATVNTTFTQPTLDKSALNTDQTAHSHSISSDLGSVNLSHSHITSSQSTSTTSDGLHKHRYPA